ncbi:MAG: hypothetical protein KDA58_03830 [Planctomycetaceae bacterium]|nr:hypothetical protein [Planctomycetaceae bacterium]
MFDQSSAHVRTAELLSQLKSPDPEIVAVTLLELGRTEDDLNALLQISLGQLCHEDRSVRRCAVHTIEVLVRRGADGDLPAMVQTLERMGIEDDLNGAISDTLVTLQGTLLNRQRWVHPEQESW